MLLAQATGGSAPDSYTATYGDWQLDCLRNAADPAAKATCRVLTVVFAEGQQQPFAQIAFSLSADSVVHLTLLVPLNALLRQPPLVGTDEADPGIAVPWLTCQPQGCAADAALAEVDLQRLRDYAAMGRLLFADVAGNAITVSFSFRGLAQALDALAAEVAK